MSYLPDPRKYQQDHDNDPTGNVDCTAEAGAWITDAHTSGAVMLDPFPIRRASGEYPPDPASPGLNLRQVRDAIAKLTAGAVVLDVREGIDNATAQARIAGGEWAAVQLDRGVLVRRGLVSGFTGGHAVTVHGSAVMGDPLVPEYVPLTWADLWTAAGSFTRPGHVNAAFLSGPAPARYLVVVRGRVPVYNAPGGPRTKLADHRPAFVSSGSYDTVRESHGGKWWYRVTGPAHSGIVGRWLPAEPVMTATAE